MGFQVHGQGNVNSHSRDWIQGAELNLKQWDIRDNIHGIDSFVVKHCIGAKNNGILRLIEEVN